jgi:3-oxoacyl-[acyl-carrier-protein] synthase II
MIDGWLAGEPGIVDGKGACRGFDGAPELTMKEHPRADHFTQLAVTVSSTKSTIGHLLGAAGAEEAVATLGTLAAHRVPANLGRAEPDPDIDLDIVADSARPMASDRPIALSNSSGFGGHNAVLALAGPRA